MADMKKRLPYALLYSIDYNIDIERIDSRMQYGLKIVTDADGHE